MYVLSLSYLAEYESGAGSGSSVDGDITGFVQGHHIYKRIWNPTVTEEFNCMRETTNTKDPYTVAVM